MLNKTVIAQAVELMQNNKLVILPTDTIYGLSGIANQETLLQINQLKKAPIEKPLVVLINSLDQLKNFNLDVRETDKLFDKIPTTVIYQIKEKTQTLAVRLVKRKDISLIIDQVGPIYSSSVNKHGQKPIVDKQKLLNFSEMIKVFFDGSCQNAQPSRIYSSVEKKWIR